MSFRLGQRVAVGDNLGTIRFAGSVGDTAGFWYGIEWDDNTRGKHDGTHNGQQYFTTSGGPTCASFVKERKLSAGTDIASAIAQRYSHDASTDDDIFMAGSAALQQRLAATGQLTEMTLAGMQINDSVPDNLAELCPRVQHLDLSGNLLTSLKAVFAICRQLPCLTSLVLNNNRFVVDCTADELGLPNLERLLFCSIPHVQWHHVLHVARLLPALRELHACELELSTLHADETHVALTGTMATSLQHVRELNLYGNCISSWHEVAHLGSLPALRMLLLHHNKLSDVPDDVTFSHWHLETLSLSSNLISTWRSVAAVGSIPGLQRLKLKNNPVLAQKRESESRKICIATLPESVSELNGSVISKQERLVAFRFYSEAMAQAYLSAKASGRLPQLFLHHPGLERVIKELGEPDAPLRVVSRLLEDGLEQVVVSCGEKETAFHVPPSVTVGYIKTLACRRLALGPGLRYAICCPLASGDAVGEHVELEKLDERQFAVSLISSN